MSKRPSSAPPTGPSTKGAELVKLPMADAEGKVAPLVPFKPDPEPSAPMGQGRRRRTMKKRKTHRRKTHHRRR